ncbi:PilZ domain-containing protein [Marinobacter orientalis]|uniref:PilZ domain-containing protein n=1 Tax=Marinobacter orientalis TaxID=1928859 RepID=A0A7Y0WS84_9GAMM|nr:PilZ domain-containing protein [Marinobacter orientalis]NMT63713.1 PilZ domain-containing protein [Marinobacter orientalis]TGX49827.1 PilZ domain-containing protein [Marinobacter orientalis]
MSDIDYSFGDRDDSPASGDNRSEYRLTARAKVTLELESSVPDDAGESIERLLVSQTSDLSATGIRLVSSEPLTRQAILSALVSLEEVSEPFRLIVEVVWCRPDDAGGWLVGLQILASDDTAYLEWVEAIARAMSEG